MMSLKYFFLIILNCILLNLGQIFLKFGMDKLQKITLAVIFNPLIIIGFIIMFIQSVLWLYILPKVQFSLAYPLNSISYIFSIIVSIMIFNENLTLGKVLGVLIIIIGITVMFKL